MTERSDMVWSDMERWLFSWLLRLVLVAETLLEWICLGLLKAENYCRYHSRSKAEAEFDEWFAKESFYGVLGKSIDETRA